MLEGLYQYFARGSAYNLAPGAADSISRLRSRGMKTAVVSNFDTRLHRILRELKVDHLFDAIIVSGATCLPVSDAWVGCASVGV
jgi:FMN phosphatase YigB (HAD superfamily)